MREGGSGGNIGGDFGSQDKGGYDSGGGFSSGGHDSTNSGNARSSSDVSIGKPTESFLASATWASKKADDLQSLREEIDSIVYEMSPREREMADMEYDFLINMKGEYDSFTNALANLTGYTGEGGQWRPMTEDEFKSSMDTMSYKDRELYQLMQGRQELALKGTLPVSEGMQQQKERTFRNLKDTWGNLIQGESFETAKGTDTASIQALNAAKSSMDLRTDEERRGEISGGVGRMSEFRGMMGRDRLAKREGIESYLGRNMPVFKTADYNRQITREDQLTGLSQKKWQYGAKEDIFRMKYNIDAGKRAQQSSDSSGFWSTVGTIGGIAAKAYFSDKRLKEDIEPIKYGLDEVKKLEPKSYKMKGEAATSMGVIAQDVVKVIPEVVVDGEYLGVNYQMFIPVLIKAIQEQQKQIDELARR